MIPYLSEPRAPAPLLPLAAVGAVGRPEAEQAAWSHGLRRFVDSLERRVADCLSRRVVGDLCLMVSAVLIGLSGFLCHIVY
jgi:hypothetical protein